MLNIFPFSPELTGGRGSRKASIRLSQSDRDVDLSCAIKRGENPDIYLPEHRCGNDFIKLL